MDLVLSNAKKNFCLNCGRKMILSHHKMYDGSSLCDACFYHLRIDDEFTEEIYKRSNREQIVLRLQQMEDVSRAWFKPWYSNYSDMTIEQADKLGFDKSFNVSEKFGSIYFNDVNGLFARGRGADWQFIYKNNEYMYKDILNFELMTDGHSEMSGGVGMALVGGALLGTAGAIAGAATRQNNSKIDDISIKIVTRSETLFFPFLLLSCDKNSMHYKKAVKEAHEAMGKLQQIADIQSSLKNKGNNSGQSTVDELLKLQTLLENKIITQDEFLKLKSRMINKGGKFDDSDYILDSATKFCFMCGKELPQSASFCPHCGNKYD